MSIFVWMNNIELINCCLLGAVIGISTLCGLVLHQGGFVANHTDGGRDEEAGKTSLLQKSFGVWTFFIATLFVGYFILYYLLDSPDMKTLRVLDILSTMALASVVMNAFLLQQVKLTLKHWLLFVLPFIPLLILAVLIPKEQSELFVYAYILVYVLVIGACVYSLYRLNKWDQEIRNYYSDIINKQTRWYRNLMMPFIGLSLTWMPIYYWHPNWIDTIYYLAIILILIRTTTHALTQEEFAPLANERPEMQEEEEAKEVHTKIKTRHSGIEEEKVPSWFEKMERMLHNDGLYHKADLTVVELAKMVGTNRTYISQYLNEHLNMTFFDYITNYRLDESEELLREGKLGITEIAIRVGFKDRNAFYRVFRMRHNCSPREWIKREKEKDL